MEPIESIFQDREGLDILRGMADFIRPRSEARSAESNLKVLIEYLKKNRLQRSRFAAAVRETASSLSLVHALVESGITSDRSLRHDLKKAIGRAFMPPARPENDLGSVLLKIFSHDDDWKWVAGIRNSLWTEMFAFAIRKSDAMGLPHEDIASAARALAQRIGALGIDEEVNRRLKHVADYDSPFLELSTATYEFIEDHRRGRGGRESYSAMVARSRKCRELVHHLRAYKHIYGTSMRLTAITRRLTQQLNRLDLLIHIVRPDDPEDFASSVVPLLQNLLRAEQEAGSPGRIFAQHLDLLAYQVTEHTADKGEKYAAHSPRDYAAFLGASLLGGAIVAVFAVFKLFLSALHAPPAVQALLYGFNYALCFIMIYVTGGILATKQPAVTASTLARALEEAPGSPESRERVAEMIKRIWRSQFISFVGNLVCAFPMAVLIAYILEQVLGIVAADQEKSAALLLASHPWKSGALFYAGVAGVFLFIAGVIQGAVDNRIVFTDAKESLRKHPALAFLGRRRDAVVDFAAKHAGGIMGNSILGFCLGSAGTLGLIFGVPFDIRHIAFSSAHFGVAFLEAPALLNPGIIAITLTGILGIGLVNFIVSFGLTLLTALESRDVSLAEGGALFRATLKNFFAKPWQWFLPERVNGETVKR